jgi:hypothetical protein
MKAQNHSFTYYDSVAGEQQKKHKTLSEIIKYIENFGYHGDSEGTVFCDGVPITEYVSRKEKLTLIHLKRAPSSKGNSRKELHSAPLQKKGGNHE